MKKTLMILVLALNSLCAFAGDTISGREAIAQIDSYAPQLKVLNGSDLTGGPCSVRITTLYTNAQESKQLGVVYMVGPKGHITADTQLVVMFDSTVTQVQDQTARVRTLDFITQDEGPYFQATRLSILDEGDNSGTYLFALTDKDGTPHACIIDPRASE